jgi:hypothetical protein
MDGEVAARIRTALDLFEVAESMVRQRLRREHPELDDDAVEERVLAWVRHRPGAEHGDAAGTPRAPRAGSQRPR